MIRLRHFVETHCWYVDRYVQDRITAKLWKPSMAGRFLESSQQTQSLQQNHVRTIAE